MLYYVHDPMCSWCWGFAPVLAQLLQRLPAEIRVMRLLGGLAVDSDQPMPVALQRTIEATWQRIQERIPGTQFNYDFWRQCAPRRSTWPACRAVIAARAQGDEFDERMTRAIQLAYYTQARNPSDEHTLLELADELGLDSNAFAAALAGKAVQQQLLGEIERARQLHATGFPSLVLDAAGSIWPIAVDYNDSVPVLEMINGLR
ncbi:MAG: DsbA family protein [Gammaproteobacteria bacterium]|nr:DsbA family protein [Gammaproteobacteria bacterium]